MVDILVINWFLHVLNISGFFWRAGFFPANQSFLNCSDWLQYRNNQFPPKSHFSFGHANRVNIKYIPRVGSESWILNECGLRHQPFLEIG